MINKFAQKNIDNNGNNNNNTGNNNNNNNNNNNKRLHIEVEPNNMTHLHVLKTWFKISSPVAQR